MSRKKQKNKKNKSKKRGGAIALQYALTPIFKSVANYRLYNRLINSYNVVKDKYKTQYAKLNKDEIEDFKYAIILLKENYHETIGSIAEVFKSTLNLDESCENIDSLDKKNELIYSIETNKTPDDFLAVFKQPISGSGKFKTLYDDLIQNPILGDTQSKEEAIQGRIEELFTIDKKNCSYLIPYLLYDIYHKGAYIDKDIKNYNYKHKNKICNFLHIGEEYIPSFILKAYKTGKEALSGGLPGMPAKPGMPGMPAKPGLPEKPGMPGMPEKPGMPGMPAKPGVPALDPKAAAKSKADAKRKAFAKGKSIDPMQSFSSGMGMLGGSRKHYSKRAFPKKRIPTIKTVKVIK